MLTPSPTEWPDRPDWAELLDNLQKSETLAAIVIAAWHIGLYVARTLVEQQLNDRAQQPTSWGQCPVCGHRLHSKGFVPRQMLTLTRELASSGGPLPTGLSRQSVSPL